MCYIRFITDLVCVRCCGSVTYTERYGIGNLKSFLFKCLIFQCRMRAGVDSLVCVKILFPSENKGKYYFLVFLLNPVLYYWCYMTIVSLLIAMYHIFCMELRILYCKYYDIKWKLYC